MELDGALAAEADAEDEPAAAKAIEGDGLTRELMRSPARKRGDERPDHDPLRGHRDGGERDPRIGDGADRLPVGDVVPDEEPIPPPPLGTRGELGHEGRLGQLLEGSDEDAPPSGRNAHSLGIRIQRTT